MKIGKGQCKGLLYGSGSSGSETCLKILLHITLARSSEPCLRREHCEANSERSCKRLGKAKHIALGCQLSRHGNRNRHADKF